ncbi:MAG: metallophosphoesterase [Butyrivibrio sp.]|nr:metallophosphoesterase [Butyrivibrio sp.]
MKKKTAAKMTMAVAVSWGMFIGASVVGYANDVDEDNNEDNIGDVDEDNGPSDDEEKQDDSADEQDENVSNIENIIPAEQNDTLPENKDAGSDDKSVEENKAEEIKDEDTDNKASEEIKDEETGEKKSEEIESEEIESEETSETAPEEVKSEEKTDIQEVVEKDTVELDVSEVQPGLENVATDEAGEGDTPVTTMMLRSAAPRMMTLGTAATPDTTTETETPETTTTEAATSDSSGGETAQPQQLIKAGSSEELDNGQPATQHISIAILSDTHYVSNDQKQGHGIQNMDTTAVTEMRMLEEIDNIINVSLDQVTEFDPDCLLICGDLTSNGEYSGAQALADKLNALKSKDGMEDVGIYVVNGNHDINNSYAADLTPEEIAKAQRIGPEDFKTVFAGLGYGENDHCEGGTRTVYNPQGDDPSVAQNHGGLSYATEIADGVTLVVMDTGIYSYEDLVNSRYGNAQKTAGFVSDGLLKWVVEQTQAAKEKGNLVLGMCHHSIIPHCSIDTKVTQAYMSEYIIGNHEQVSAALADAGMSAVLTGHSHANDIAKYVSENGNVLYDIQTAALCAYPVAWRQVNIDITGSGKDAVYNFSIDTSFIDKDFGDVDTSNWSVSTGGTVKKFDDDYQGSMQDYSYDKSGIRQESIGSFIDYFAREIAYSITETPGGTEAYLKNTIKYTEDSLGDYALNQTTELARKNDKFATDFNIPYLGNVSITAIRTSDGSEDSIIKYDVSIKDSTTEEKGTLKVNLTALSGGVNKMVTAINNYLNVDGWKESNYKSSPIQKEVVTLLSNALVNALSKPIDEKDPTSTGMNIAIDAQQAFARGDEGSVQTEKRAKYQALLKGETFEKYLNEALWGAIGDATLSSKYPILAGILSTSIAPEGQNTIAAITDVTSPTSMYITIVNGLASTMNSASNIVRAINALPGFNASSVMSFASKQLINAFAEVQLSMTQDNNIPNDSKWQFHTINLYMGDDYEIVRNTLTVEQFKAGKLITPSMEDYEFAGWYTAPDGGTLVTADSDFTSIYKLYARWNYVGDDDDEDYDDDWYEDYEDDDDFWDEIDEPIEDDGTTVRDYVETEKEVKEDLDDALELLDKINTETIKKTGIDSPSGGAISLLQKDNLSGEIKIGRYISDSIVDGQGNQITDKVFVTDTGRIGINLGKLDYLTPSLLKTLNGVDADIELYFMYKGKLTRLIIPKGTDLSKYVDKNGFVGLLYLKQLIEIGQLI